MESHCSLGTVSTGEEKKFCMNVGDVCIKIRMYLMYLNYTHATVARISFYGLFTLS